VQDREGKGTLEANRALNSFSLISQAFHMRANLLLSPQWSSPIKAHAWLQCDFGVEHQFTLGLKLIAKKCLYVDFKLVMIEKLLSKLSQGLRRDLEYLAGYFGGQSATSKYLDGRNQNIKNCKCFTVSATTTSISVLSNVLFQRRKQQRCDCYQHNG
jgi:hypothetical protein